MARAARSLVGAPHARFQDVEAADLMADVVSAASFSCATIRGTNAHFAKECDFGSVHAATLFASRVAFARGPLRRAYFLGAINKFDPATVGTVAEYFLSVPKRVRLVNFGVQSVASDVVFATNDTMELRTNKGTKLATIVGDGDVTLGTRKVRKDALETATEVATDKVLIVTVGTNAFLSGSVVAFVDYQTVDPEPAF